MLKKDYNHLNGNSSSFDKNNYYDEILEAVWMCREKNSKSISDIKEECDIEITDELIEKIKLDKLVSFDNENIIFTEEGEKKARNIIRRHRLAECLLFNTLSLKDDQLESVACSFEHVLIPEVEESICTLLGHPETCPHGLRIPKGSCCEKTLKVNIKTIISLKTLEIGSPGKIAYIRPKEHNRMHQLCSFGIIPGVIIKLHQKAPSYIIQFENLEIALDEDVAEDIYVWPQ